MRAALSWAVGALFCAVAAWGSPHGAAGHEAALVLRSSETVPPLVIQQARKELRRLAISVPLSVSWHLRDPGGQVRGRLVSVRLHGGCAGTGSSASQEWGPLATARSQDGRVQPFVDVYCDRIEAVIAAQVRNYQPLMRQVHFARALARVLAHELYHVLTGTHVHTDEGLTKARLSGAELTANRADFVLTLAERHVRVDQRAYRGGGGDGIAGR